MSSNAIAVIFNNIVIYWPSLIIALGIIACITMTLALWKPKNRSSAGLWLFFLLSILLGFFLSRLFHWYFNMEQYSAAFGTGIFSTFITAFTNYSIGSYCLPGVIIGILISACIVHGLGYVSSTGRLLDFVSPGIMLLAALIRLSALFNTSCRGKRPVTVSLFQRLPFCIAVTDSAGNVSYRLAVFFIEFILLIIAFFIVIRFFMKKRTAELLPPCKNAGHVWRFFLVYYSVIEIIMDSLRTDSPLMHFTFLTKLNAYSAFISFAQISSLAFLIYVFVYYTVYSIRSTGFSWKHIAGIVLFIACLVGAGFFGEYSIQRYGRSVSGYICMTVSLIIIIITCKTLYSSCTPAEEYYE